MQTVYVFMGMVASGKSTLATAFSGRYGMPCYNTDRIRKEIAGLSPSARRPDGVNQGIYSTEYTRRTYQAMIERAAEDLEAGSRGVVLDGSYSSRDERKRVREMAADHGAGCVFVLCRCSEDEVRRRLEYRARDPQAVSDGRWEIYQQQKKNFEVPPELDETELFIMDTAMDIGKLLEKLRRVLNL